MTTPTPSPATPAQARNRWLMINAFRLLGIAGAFLGIMLIARAQTWPPKILGVAIVLSAIYMAWTIPAALAHRWATPGNVQTNRRRPKKINR